MPTDAAARAGSRHCATYVSISPSVQVRSGCSALVRKTVRVKAGTRRMTWPPSTGEAINPM